MSFQKYVWNSSSYDETEQVTAKINDFKASLNKLRKIKGQEQIGDHEKFDQMTKKTMYLAMLSDKFRRELRDLKDKDQEKSIATIDREILTMSETFDLGIKPAANTLSKLRNEAFVAFMCHEMNKRRISLRDNDIYVKRSSMQGLLKDVTPSSISGQMQPTDTRSVFDRFSDKNNDYKRLIDIFEEQNDNQLTSLNTTSDNLKMDNATFINVSAHISQKGENPSIFDGLVLSQTMKPWSMPFYNDGTNVTGTTKEQNADYVNILQLSAVADITRTFKSITAHMLQLQRDGMLTQVDLNKLIEIIDIMDPGMVMVLLAQDLELYRNIVKLNDRLMDEEFEIKTQQN